MNKLHLMPIIKYLLAVAVLSLAAGAASGATFSLMVNTNGEIVAPAYAVTNLAGTFKGNGASLTGIVAAGAQPASANLTNWSGLPTNYVPGQASHATNADLASLATEASHATNADLASLATEASHATNADNATLAATAALFTDGNGLATTNFALSVAQGVGRYMFFSTVTNSVRMAQGAGAARTNIFQGWTISPTAITTQTLASLAVGAYVRHMVSTQSVTRIEAGPSTVTSFAYRAGGGGTVSFHYEIYALDTVYSNLVELGSSAPQIVTATTPTTYSFSINIPTTYFATNDTKFCVAVKIDQAGTGAATLNLINGATYDAHASFIQPISVITIDAGQITGTFPGNVTVASNIYAGRTLLGTASNSIPSDVGGNLTPVTNSVMYLAASPSNGDAVTLDAAVTAANNSAGIVFRRSLGAISAPADCETNGQLGYVDFRAYSGTQYVNIASIDVKTDGAFISGNKPPTKMRFATAAGNADPLTQVQITPAGDVEILRGKLGVKTTSPMTAFSNVSYDGDGNVMADGLLWVNYANDNYIAYLKSGTYGLRLLCTNTAGTSLVAGSGSSANLTVDSAGIKATGYRSSDNSAGITSTKTLYTHDATGAALITNTVTIKDGLITGWAP